MTFTPCKSPHGYLADISERPHPAPNRTTTHLSTHKSPTLEAQTDTDPNRILGRGQFHFGLLKKPTDTPAGGNITTERSQEGVIYPGAFQEEFSRSFTSLSLWLC